MPLFSRLVYAISTLFRILFDGDFALRVKTAVSAPAALPPAEAEPAPAPKPAPPSTDAALTLLGLLQREGRLVDFLQQDIEGFPDAEIGAAVRVVHGGCKKALAAHVVIEPIRAEDEGTAIALQADFDKSTVKLTGNVGGGAPYRGTVRHKGWRVKEISLPERVEGFDVRVLAPAEIEL